MSCIDALGLGGDTGLTAGPGFVCSLSVASSPGPSSDISNCLGPGSVGVEDRDPCGDDRGRDERAGLGARMIGTVLGRTLSAKEPRLVGELLLLVSEGNGGCNTTQTCCCPPPGGDEMLLLPCLRGVGRSESGLSVFSSLSARKKNNKHSVLCLRNVSNRNWTFNETKLPGTEPDDLSTVKYGIVPSTGTPGSSGAAGLGSSAVTFSGSVFT